MLHKQNSSYAQYLFWIGCFFVKRRPFERHGQEATPNG